MDQVDVREVQRLDQALTGAWKRWEEDPTKTTDLHAASVAARQFIDRCESAGGWLPQPLRQLREKVQTLDALQTQRRQEQERGY